MIKENPFYILEVSTRDTRQKIVEMAEDKSLELDEELVQKAQSNLVTPSRRLTAELDWFPGVAPARISKIIDALDSGNLGQINQYDLPVLAHINFYIELLENNPNMGVDCKTKNINQDCQILIYEKYLIFYRIENISILIGRILHSSINYQKIENL